MINPSGIEVLKALPWLGSNCVKRNITVPISDRDKATGSITSQNLDFLVASF